MKWQEINSGEKNNLPTAITSNCERVTSQKEIANVLATYFDESVEEIRKTFTENKDLALKALKALKPETSKKFNFNEIDRFKMYRIINKAKNSRTSSDDNGMMDMIRQIPSIMAIILTHLFNLIIRKKKFPQCLKNARLMPLKKPGKCILDKTSYTPISILPWLKNLLRKARELK